MHLARARSRIVAERFFLGAASFHSRKNYAKGEVVSPGSSLA